MLCCLWPFKVEVTVKGEGLRRALLIFLQRIPHAPMFVTTTIAMVYWTVFVQGITIKPLVKFLNVKTKSDVEITMNERIAGRFMDHVVAGMEGILGEVGNLRYVYGRRWISGQGFALQIRNRRSFSFPLLSLLL